MNRIREFRSARGWSLQNLAEAAGTSKSQIDKLEKGARRLTVDWMMRLAKPLGCDPRDLLPHAAPETRGMKFKSVRPGAGKAANANTVLIPVRNAAGTAVDHVPRPYYLMHAKDAYALYVTDAAMTPMYRPGQMLFVNPYKPASSGDGVVITGKKGEMRVRELVEYGPRTVTLREYHPERRDFAIALRDIEAIHTVAGTMEP